MLDRQRRRPATFVFQDQPPDRASLSAQGQSAHLASNAFCESWCRPVGSNAGIWLGNLGPRRFPGFVVSDLGMLAALGVLSFPRHDYHRLHNSPRPRSVFVEQNHIGLRFQGDVKLYQRVGAPRWQRSCLWW
jgi:hypothetical protein